MALPLKALQCNISIHAAQEGCDLRFYRTFSSPPISIHAAQEGCDTHWQLIPSLLNISIHAAQEGCDNKYFCHSSVHLSISIHAAQEGCDCGGENAVMHLFEISIHAAQEGCDDTLAGKRACRSNFNPRSPRGLRRKKGSRFNCPLNVISIHAAQEGCDRVATVKIIADVVRFQSTQPKRAAT